MSEALLFQLKQLEQRYHELEQLRHWAVKTCQRVEMACQTETNPSIQIQREVELEKAERDRKKIEDEILRIIRQKERLEVCRVYNALVRLDCREHVRRFNKFIIRHHIGAFLIHGNAKYGMRFFVARVLRHILRKVGSSQVAQVVKLKLASSHKVDDVAAMMILEEADSGVDSFWDTLGRAFGLRYAIVDDIAQRIVQKRQTGHVVVILEMDNWYEFEQIIQEYWGTLAKTVQQLSPQTKNVFLLMCVINENDDWDESAITWAETYQESWTPEFPVKLPIIQKYCAKDLETWIEDQTDILPPEIWDNIAETVESILRHSENGLSDRVIRYICNHLCQCEFHEGVLEEWLKC